MTTTTAATNLTDEQIDALRDQSRREAGSFVDPCLMRDVESWWHRALNEWIGTIIGRDFPGMRQLSWRETYLLDLARKAEPNPPTSPTQAALRAEYDTECQEWAEEAELATRDWEALRGRLPVKVEVAHNYTSARHLDGYSQGADHIIALEDLTVGRLHRQARKPLCYVPSKARDLSVFDDAGDHRRPTCKACLRTARRVAGVAQ